MSALVTFASPNGEHVRVFEMNGQPWFVAADVCRALSIANARDAVAALDDDEKGVAIADTPGGEQELNAISEAGLYSLVLRSRKPEAKTFKRWVTHEVLPTIRRTGTYTAQRALPQPEASPLALAELMLNELKSQNQRLASVEDATRVLAAEHHQLKAKVERRHPDDDRLELVTPTTLGALMSPPISGQAMNRVLREVGLQWKQDGRWVPTADGREYGEMVPVIIGVGECVEVLRWQRRVLDVVERRLARRAANGLRVLPGGAA